MIAQAERALASGHPQQAEALIREALETHDLPALHRTLADCLEAQGNFKSAAEEYRTAATADPSEPNLFAFGSELLKYRGYPQAVQVFSFAAARFTNSARILVGLGIAQYSVGAYDPAVAALCHAVDLDPADTRALSFLGSMVGVSPTLTAAVRTRLDDFATRYPRNAAALYYDALSLPSSAHSKTEALLQRAVALQPVFADAHFHLGMLYQDNKQMRQAIAEYRIAIAQQPGLTAAHYRLAQLYQQQGQHELAKQQFALVKAAKPLPASGYPAKSAADDK